MLSAVLRCILSRRRSLVGLVVVLALAPAASRAVTPTAVIWYSRARTQGATDGSVWKVNGDGTGDGKITDGQWPRLSPNGDLLLFHKDSTDNTFHNNVYVRNLGTSGETKIIDNNDYVVHFDWNADESRVIFDYSCAIYVAHTDGSMWQTLVSGDCYDDAPMLNPVDGRIALHNQSGIWVADANGANKTHVDNTQGGDYWPAWSSDGQWLSFERYGNNALAPDVYKVKPNGTSLTQLTPHHPDTGEGWGPRAIWTTDGAHVIAPGTVFGVKSLYAIPTDGSGTVLRLSIGAGNAPDFVGSVVGSAVTGTGVLPTTTTTTTTSTTTTSTTTTTTSTTTRPTTTSTSTTTTTVTSTTATTLPAGGETCGNCTDDDHDGLVDAEDPDCCTGGALPLAITTARLMPKKGTSQLALRGALGTTDLVALRGDVSMVLRAENGAVACVHLPASLFASKGRTVGFRIRKGRALPGGVDHLIMRVLRHGTDAKLDVGAQALAFATPGAGNLRVSLGIASATGDRCGSRTEHFKASRRGALRFP